MERADGNENHSAYGCRNPIAGYYRASSHLADARSWGTGPMVAIRPGIRMPVPVESTQYHNAGFAPTMGFIQYLGGIANAVGGIVDWISGGPQKRARQAAAQRAHEEDMMEQQLRAAQLQAETTRYQAEVSLAAQQAQAKNQMMMILALGALGIGGIVIASAMKKKG